MPEMTVSITRRAGLRVAFVMLWTVIRAYLDGSRTVTFYIGSDDA